MKHSQKAADALKAQNFADADRETETVLAEAGKFGGKSPPDAEPPFMDRIFPVQDSGEQLSYAGGLRHIGNQYSDAKKYEMAEKLYRKALELDTAKFGASSKPVTTWALPALIDLMKRTGRDKEALELKLQRAAALAAYSKEHNDKRTLEESLLEEADVAEKQGDIQKAEELLVRRIKLFEGDFDEAKLLKLKKANEHGESIAGGHPAVISMLDSLADFYGRQKEYAKELKTLDRAQSLRLAVLPAWSNTVEDGWEDQQEVYELMRNDEKVAELLSRRIECMKANKHERNDERIAKCFKQYASVLEKLGRAEEASKARRQAHEITPR